MTITQDGHTSSGWTPDDQSFGARLALVRQRMSWGNIKEAAVACGLPPESWRTWERDNVAPRRIVEVSAVIAAKTGCDRWWLLTGERVGRGQAGRDLTEESGRSTVRTVRLRHLAGWGIGLPTYSGKPLTVHPAGRPRMGEAGHGIVRPARLPRHEAA